MRLVHFYPQPSGKKERTRNFRSARSLFLAGMLLVAAPLVSRAASPFALYGASQTHTICDNQPIDVSEWLKVADIDLDETLTWTVVTTSGGTLSGDGATASSGGSGSTPGGGMIFTPTPGATSGGFSVIVDDGTGNNVLITVLLTINGGPSLSLGTMPAVCQGVTLARIPFGDLHNVGPDTVVFNYTGAPQTWTVPSNVTNVRFDVMGASGGFENYYATSTPGKGGRVQGILSVLPNTNLSINVGGRGGDGSPSGAIGGWNGGGSASFYFYASGGAGGGASDIRIGGTGLANRKIVAGGGGGAGADLGSTKRGGAGGGLTGGSSEINDFNSPARGGNQSAGGAAAVYFGWASGTFGASGVGGNGSVDGISGGGGGGYFGGGGGVWNGGGGGSSYTDGTSVSGATHTQGVHEGDGVVNLYYVDPGTYTIIWDAAADAAGFLNVANAVLPTDYDFDVAVPASAAAGTYHGTLTINNMECYSVEYPISITVKPRPTISAVPDVTVCHGDMVPDIFFSSSVSGSANNWVNDNPAIGLVASGEGHIPGFAPINTTPFPVSAMVTVTPVADGCIGLPTSFNIVDNPIPMLNSTTTPAYICNNSLFSYIPNSLTPGTSFSWSRAAVTGIANPANSGVGNPNETLTNLTEEPIAVTYVYTLTANGCSNVQNVTVVVNPTATLSSTLTPAAVCNGAPFVYNPTTGTTGASISWSRGVAAGISNGAATGMGSISETLNNVSTTPRTATYVISLTIDGCTTTQNVPVTVNPVLTLTSGTTPLVACEGQLVTYEATSNVPVATLSWSRAAVAGIDNPAATGVGNIAETLSNSTPAAITVTYVYTLSAYGCSTTQNLNVAVRPIPVLSSTLTPADICTNSLFAYTPTSATSGASFRWFRDLVPGVSNPIADNVPGSISEILVSTADTAVIVPYVYEVSAAGCNGSDTVRVRVNPLPKLSNDLSSLAVCDSAIFNFTPTSILSGATFAWSRAFVSGISNLANTGTNNPAERLNNTTYISVPVTYVYTVTANGCTNTQAVVVNVRPSALLETDSAITCSGAPFEFKPVSFTTTATFEWSRAAISGITPSTRNGAGNIVDTLTSSSTSDVAVTYDFELNVAGCINEQKFTVIVNPAPAVPVIGTKPASTVCANSTFLNFGAATLPPSGMSYSWSAEGATVHSTGSTGQYAVVSFPAPGTATVTLTAMNNATTCMSKTNTEITVSTAQAYTPNIIYFDGQFICQETGVKSYQWGYDDTKTMDSTILVGETNQNYYNPVPGLEGRNYWVITDKDGCVQKTYYNVPTGVIDMSQEAASMKLYPNPASNVLNMQVNSVVRGEITFQVYDLMGRQLTTVKAINNSASVNVDQLAAGAYMVECYADGAKVAAARFIKN